MGTDLTPWWRDGRDSVYWVKRLTGEDMYDRDESNIRRWWRGETHWSLLGTAYVNGDYRVEGTPGRRGPAAASGVYALPPGTKGVSIEQIPEPVSSAIYVRWFDATKTVPTISLALPLSGQVVEFVVDPPWPEIDWPC